MIALQTIRAALRLYVLAALLVALVASCGAPAPISSPAVTPAASGSVPGLPTSDVPPADPCNIGSSVYCVVNPNVTQATIKTTICKTGWTATVRPPVSYTEPLKISQIKAEGLPSSPSLYEEDHRLPLELGGSPRDVHNLSPEAHPGSYTKDHDENVFRSEVCAGKLSLAAAQQQFVAKWLAAYPGYRS